MNPIRKFRSYSLFITAAGESLGHVTISKAVLLGAFLYTFTVAHVLVGIAFYFQDTSRFYSYLTEDGYIEYFTSFFLLATSLYCFYKAPRMDGKWAKAFYYVAAAVFFFGFGEEISWGQRLLGFEVPDDLEKINPQSEFNLHNIHLNGVNLNKLIFGKILYLGVFVYFLALPVLYRHRQWFRQLVDKIRLPLPTPLQALLYTLLFISLLLINDGKKWELQEFVLVSFIFYAFLFPYNRETSPPV
ncbi:hypothetical protein [Pontibacter amylolyticus]|uniref:CPBP family intramembrane metalloprotease n=1 Tax=Pontibacter amylolyticus TaxID=1424080 RepID=A0ABQ1W6S0_9BACT|nr:hypothetical protein [Pontibacter amylolyticus]GGG17844.1 hypothetical protein GCM10011323_22620 [Pontibacter amylolyticus]